MEKSSGNGWGVLYSKEVIINSLAPGRFECNFRSEIFKLTLVIDGWGISGEIAHRWMSMDYTDNELILVQVMAWCPQATSHYLSQCWPRSMSPYGTGPQWVNHPWYVLTYLHVGHGGWRSNMVLQNKGWIYSCIHLSKWLSWFIKHLPDDLYIFYINLWSLIRHLGLAVRNVWHVWCFSPALHEMM